MTTKLVAWKYANIRKWYPAMLFFGNNEKKKGSRLADQDRINDQPSK